MADSGTETSKKSGFSFRKKRSNSKTRKEEAKHVDSETVNDQPEIENPAGEMSAGEEIGCDSSKEQVGTTSDVEPVSCGEETSPKADDQSPESQTTTKKKSKRRSRSLFRSRKRSKTDKSVERSKDGAIKPSSEEASQSCPTTDDNTVAEQVVVCDDIRAQSDVEYGGEASETDGEFARDDEDDEDEAKASGNETGDETKKDGGQKTKKKGFFKRGLSLRRSKGKKKHNAESHDEKPANPDVDVEKPTTILKPDTISFATQTDTGNNGEAVKNTTEPSTENPTDENVAPEQKKAPAKPVRKVSFAQSSYESSEGDSPTEGIAKPGNDSQDATPAPEVAIVVSEVAAEPEAATSTTEVDDDDELTEVSSVTSSLVVSQLDEEEPTLLFESEETGSRITLVESGEIGEGSGAQPDEEKETTEEITPPEKDPSEDGKPLEEISLLEKDSSTEESTEQTGEETRPEKSTSEDDKLLEGEMSKTKDADWMLQQSCDVSQELSRVRKQTLFSVKRLCCSIM